MDAADIIEGVKAQQDNLHSNLWRQFTQSEEMLLKDLLFLPISVDATTIFGVRPPELHFVRKQRNCFCWFSCVPIKLKKCETLDYVLHQNINQKYGEMLWIDSVNNRVFLRIAAVEEVCDYLNGLKLSDYGCKMIQ